MHNLRSFLRHSVVRKLSAKRPKDYASLSSDWKESPKIREQIYMLNHYKGGPAMLPGGTLTGAIARAWGCFDDDGMCRRCGDELDTRMRWLWNCPRLDQARNKLHERLGRRIKPEDHRECLAKCGICPNEYNISLQDYVAIFEYLAEANREATECRAAYHGGKPIPPLRTRLAADFDAARNKVRDGFIPYLPKTC